MFSSIVTLYQSFVCWCHHEPCLRPPTDKYVLSRLGGLRQFAHISPLISDAHLFYFLTSSRLLFSIDHLDHFHIWDQHYFLFHRYNRVLVPKAKRGGRGLKSDDRIYRFPHHVVVGSGVLVPGNLVELLVLYLTICGEEVFEFEVFGQSVSIYGDNNLFDFFRHWVMILDHMGSFNQGLVLRFIHVILIFGFRYLIIVIIYLLVIYLVFGCSWYLGV
jgi:hypothetical protein